MPSRFCSCRVESSGKLLEDKGMEEIQPSQVQALQEVLRRVPRSVVLSLTDLLANRSDLLRVILSHSLDLESLASRPHLHRAIHIVDRALADAGIQVSQVTDLEHLDRLLGELQETLFKSNQAPPSSPQQEVEP